MPPGACTVVVWRCGYPEMCGKPATGLQEVWADVKDTEGLACWKHGGPGVEEQMMIETFYICKQCGSREIVMDSLDPSLDQLYAKGPNATCKRCGRVRAAVYMDTMRAHCEPNPAQP